MSHLPDLRDELVKAAARQSAPAAAAPVPVSRRRLRLPRPGGVALALATALPVALAVVAVIVIHPGHRRTRPGSARQTLSQELHAAAAHLLAQVTPPPGAVVTGLRAGVPADLLRPGDQLQATQRVDVYRVWHVPGAPDQAVRFIKAHRPAGLLVGGGAAAGESPKGGPFHIQMESVALYPRIDPGVRLVRELVVQAEALPHGGTALRVDAHAGWLASRTPADLIGARMVRAKVKVAGFGRSRKVHRGPARASTNAGVIDKLRVDLNDLVPTASLELGSCAIAKGVEVEYLFYRAAATRPAATAVWLTACNVVLLKIPGRHDQTLTSLGVHDTLMRHTAAIPGLASWLRRG